MANLAYNPVAVFFMIRVLHLRNGVDLTGQPGSEEWCIVFNLQVERECICSRVVGNNLMTGFAGDPFAVCFHEILVVVMAIHTGQSFLLMYIGHQFMIFNPIWSKMFLTGCKRGSIFIAEIMLVPAVIICTDKIGVVAAKALKVSWKSQNLMAYELAVAETHMAGCASSPSLRVGIVVA